MSYPSFCRPDRFRGAASRGSLVIIPYPPFPVNYFFPFLCFFPTFLPTGPFRHWYYTPPKGNIHALFTFIRLFAVEPSSNKGAASLIWMQKGPRQSRGPFITTLAERLFLRACRFRFLAALDAGAFIVFSLTELGKHARLCAGTLKASQCAVQRFIIFNADL